MTTRCSMCGSYAFNLQQRGVDQGELCDVHHYKVQRDELLGALKDAYPYVDNDDLRISIGAVIVKATGSTT